MMMKTLIVKSPCRTVIKSVWTPVPNQILSVPMYNITLLAIWMGLDTSRAVHAQMELYITMTGKRSKDKRDGKNITRLIQCLIHSSMYQTSQPHYVKPFFLFFHLWLVPRTCGVTFMLNYSVELSVELLSSPINLFIWQPEVSWSVCATVWG